MREAMATELKGRMIGGEGKVAEVDSGYFGGYVRPANIRENRVDRRLYENQSRKRQAVVIIRERDGNSLPAVFRTEGQALRTCSPHRQGHRRQRRRKRQLERAARPFRDEADQS